MRGQFTTGLVARIEELEAKRFGDTSLLNCEPVKMTWECWPLRYQPNQKNCFPSDTGTECGRWAEAGIIEWVTEPSEWSAPVVPVPKNIGKPRICVDLRKLNCALKRTCKICIVHPGRYFSQTRWLSIFFKAGCIKWVLANSPTSRLCEICHFHYWGGSALSACLLESIVKKEHVWTLKRWQPSERYQHQ